MDNLEFLSLEPGNASLTILSPDGTILAPIHGLDVVTINQECPLLAMSFERSRAGIPKAEIEASSRCLVVCFLRYLYTGDYSFNSLTYQGISEPSLLFHAQLCRLAVIYEVPGLQRQTRAEFLRELEMACCHPHPPTDLCKTIRFVYTYLADQASMIDTILHYCVSSFHYHGLGSRPDFIDLLSDLKDFTIGLFRTNAERGFEDEGAIDIICLPITKHPESVKARTDSETLRDFLHDLWSAYPSDDESNRSNEGSSSPSECSSSPSEPGALLATHRTRKRHRSDSARSTCSAIATEEVTLEHRAKDKAAVQERAFVSEAEANTTEDESLVQEPVSESEAESCTEEGWIMMKNPNEKKWGKSVAQLYPARPFPSPVHVRAEPVAAPECSSTRSPPLGASAARTSTMLHAEDNKGAEQSAPGAPSEHGYESDSNYSIVSRPDVV